MPERLTVDVIKFTGNARILNGETVFAEVLKALPGFAPRSVLAVDDEGQIGWISVPVAEAPDETPDEQQELEGSDDGQAPDAADEQTPDEKAAEEIANPTTPAGEPIVDPQTPTPETAKEERAEQESTPAEVTPAATPEPEATPEAEPTPASAKTTTSRRK